jgi:uroporphyrinogen decarboxylase
MSRSTLSQRENLLRVLRRQDADHIPFALSLCPKLAGEFRERYDTDDYEAFYGFPFRHVAPGPSRQIIDYSPWHPHLPANAWIDDWGVGAVPGSVAHFTRMLHPMETFTTADEVQRFPVPDLLADYRWQDVAGQVTQIKQQGLAVIYSAVQIFEPAWYLRGLDNLLVDMVLEPEIAAACLDRMTEVQAGIAARMAAAGVDLIVFGDDVGTQKSLMMQPETWRTWLKPTMQRAISAAKDVNPDVLAYYHSDGVIHDIIPDLIEIGVDVLNPVQPECMDPAKLKTQYGDRLSFWGTIGTQTTMPFGTPDEVRETVRLRIETVGRGGGLVIAPTHLLEPEVPWANIDALVEAVRTYGQL